MATTTTTVLDFGLIPYGSAPTLTFVFKQNGVATDPGVAPVCNLTDGAGNKTTPALTHASAGTYTLVPNCQVAGEWTGRVYAPPGTGQASQDFRFEVEATPNP